MRKGRFARLATGLLAASLLICFVQFQIRQIVTASPGYDDAFIASVAKNVASGFGYSTYYPHLIRFDPEISTGPAVVLPTALIMSIVGNQYWVPNLAITIGIWITLGFALVLLARRLRTPVYGLAVVLILSSVLLYMTEQYGLLGEAPAIFLVVIAALLLSDEHLGMRRSAFYGGVALGVALECKLIAALGIAAFPLVLLLYPRRGVGRRLAFFGLGVSIPVLLWQITQLVMLRGHIGEWIAVKQQELRFLFIGGHSLAGIGDLAEAASVTAHIRETFERNIQSLWTICGAWPFVAAFVAAVVISAVVVIRPEGATNRLASTRGPHPASLLLGIGIVHLLWWLLLSPTGWDRHLLPGAMYLLVAAALLTAECVARARVVGVVCVALLLVSWYPRAGHFREVVRFDYRPSPRLAALLAARNDLLLRQREPDVLLVGWDWWVPRDLDYLLPTSGNFQDWSRLRADEGRNKRLVLVRNEYFNEEESAWMDSLRDLCDADTLFRQEPVRDFRVHALTTMSANSTDHFP